MVVCWSSLKRASGYSRPLSRVLLDWPGRRWYWLPLYVYHFDTSNPERSCEPGQPLAGLEEAYHYTIAVAVDLLWGGGMLTSSMAGEVWGAEEASLDMNVLSRFQFQAACDGNPCRRLLEYGP